MNESENMNDRHREQLSAFIDNEVGPEELSGLEAGDVSLHRYQLIGDAIRGSLSDASLVDVSAQVRAAIDAEPAHSISTRKTAQATSSTGTWFDLGAWLRPVGGLAVAASVAVVMVLVVSQPETGEIGINNSGGQVAIDSRPVVSLPVNNAADHPSAVTHGRVTDDEEETPDNRQVIQVYPQQ